MTLWGMDISLYQPQTPDMTGLDFVCVKASQRDYVDPYWNQHRADVRAAGLFLVAYHFGVDFDVATQVATFIGAAQWADAWVLDFETDPNGHSMSQGQARDFIARMQSAGYPCGLYDNCSNHFDAGQNWHWLADPANYCPNLARAIVQTRSGVPRGDHSDLASLNDLLGSTGVQGFQVTQDEPHNINIPKGTAVMGLGGAVKRHTSEAKDQVGLVRGTLGNGSAVYWVVALQLDGEKDLTLVKAADVTDKGKLTGSGGGGGGGSATYQQGYSDAKSKAISAIEGL